MLDYIWVAVLFYGWAALVSVVRLVRKVENTKYFVYALLVLTAVWSVVTISQAYEPYPSADVSVLQMSGFAAIMAWLAALCLYLTRIKVNDLCSGCYYSVMEAKGRIVIPYVSFLYTLHTMHFFSRAVYNLM